MAQKAKNVRSKSKVKAVGKTKTRDNKKAPSAAEMERRARVYRHAGHLRSLALMNVNAARDVLIRTEEALNAPLLGEGHEDGKNAADDALCAAHFDAEDSFFDAVTALALASELYREAFESFVFAPGAAGAP